MGGGQKSKKKGPKWQFSPPYNFFAIGFSKKVKTLDDRQMMTNYDR